MQPLRETCTRDAPAPEEEPAPEEDPPQQNANSEERRERLRAFYVLFYDSLLNIPTLHQRGGCLAERVQCEAFPAKSKAGEDPAHTLWRVHNALATGDEKAANELNTIHSGTLGAMAAFKDEYVWRALRMLRAQFLPKVTGEDPLNERSAVVDIPAMFKLIERAAELSKAGFVGEERQQVLEQLLGQLDELLQGI